MSEPANRGEYEDDNEELVISTREELITHLEQNPEVVVGIVRHLAENFSDSYPIELVLEQGYEDAHLILDLFAENMETESFAATPYIDSSTDWGGPFEEHFELEWSKVSSDEVVLDEGLESDFGSSLLSACLTLIEEKGKARADSTFIDVFGLKVAQVYKGLLSEKLQEREDDREVEDERRQEARNKEDHVLEWVFRAKQFTLFSVPEPVPNFEVFCQVSRRICAAALKEYHQEDYHQEWLARELEKELLRVVMAGFSSLMQEFVETVSYGNQSGDLSGVLTEMKSAQDALYQTSLQGSYSGSGYSDGASLRELGIRLLQQAREDEDNKLAEERSEEDYECARESFSESLHGANSQISDWIRATIEAYGGSLVIDTAKRL